MKWILTDPLTLVRHERAIAYGIAVILALVAIALRIALTPYLTGAQFITFFPAVVLSAYFCGQRAGLITAALCGLAGWYIFVGPLYSFSIEIGTHALTLIAYVVTAAVIAVLIGASRTAVQSERVTSQALRASEEQFRILADSSPALIWVTDENAQVTFANRRYEEVFGQPSNTIKGEGWRSIVHPEDVDGFNAQFLAALTSRARFIGEVRVQNREGQIMWLHCEGVPRFTAEGTFLGYVGANLDITEAKRAEERLRELNDTLERRVEDAVAERREVDALYRTYFENSPEALFVIRVDPNDGFVVEQINPAHEAGVGLKAEDVLGRRIVDIIPPEEAAKVLPTYRRVRDTGEAFHYREVFNLSGDAQHWDTSLVPMTDASGNVTRIIGSSRNVTRQVLAEEALRQSQKMEAMGQLTGGVAHDFNNLLTPIVGSLDMLQRKGVGGEREQRLIAGAMQSAERAATLVQRLLAFARRQPLQATPVDIAKLIYNMAELISSTTGPQIEVIVEASEGLPPAIADANQLEMAVLNLAVNARDAMAGVGTLRISARTEVIDADNRSDLKEGRYIRLSVADTGAGMDEATLARAVEPFFSTKGIGKGTGLGLSMVHGLASQLGGALTIVSQPGQGTEVQLWLPESTELPQAAEMSSSPAAAKSRRGTVLLVDDEDLVRMSTADMLDDLGFSVIEAASGEEAMRLIESGASFDVLITDHLMPGMNGTDLARAVQSSRPGVPVLLVSGYAEIDGVAPEISRLTKPFRNEELASSLLALAKSN